MVSKAPTPEVTNEWNSFTFGEIERKIFSCQEMSPIRYWAKNPDNPPNKEVRNDQGFLRGKTDAYGWYEVPFTITDSSGKEITAFGGASASRQAVYKNGAFHHWSGWPKDDGKNNLAPGWGWNFSSYFKVREACSGLCGAKGLRWSAAGPVSFVADHLAMRSGHELDDVDDLLERIAPQVVDVVAFAVVGRHDAYAYAVALFDAGDDLRDRGALHRDQVVTPGHIERRVDFGHLHVAHPGVVHGALVGMQPHEVVAAGGFEAYGAAYALQELLTIKSDDVMGRAKAYEAIVKGENLPKPGIPEAMNVLLHELRGLALSVKLE